MIDKLVNLFSLPENDFDAALIISPENRRYFTEFSSSDGYLLINKKGESVFVTDSRYYEAAKIAITSCEVVLQEKSISQLTDILNSFGAKSVAVEASRMTLSTLSRFKEYFGEIEILTDNRLDDCINALRSVKSFVEVENIKSAQKIAENAFNHILDFIKVGVTEKQISLELDYFMLNNGAEALSFNTIVVSGKNSSIPHGVPSGNIVENGNFVTMDFGAVVNGYHSDMTRTVAIGDVSDTQRIVYNTVLQAQEKAIQTIRAGVSCFDVDKAARDIISSADYGEFFGHGTGHGVGIEIHEYPNLSPSSTNLLHSGNIVTVEPGIYIPTKFGVRIEDLVLVTEVGCINLTSANKHLIIL